ncbi:hypothetical protein [Terasakiella sp.]|uniref:hypothetical protein n=1 Tax=Terasakiella sp. TaxID=2034861 RepID=UPI003AA93FB5
MLPQDQAAQSRINKLFGQAKGSSPMFVISAGEATKAINQLVFECVHHGINEMEAIDRIDRAMCDIRPEPVHTSAITRFRAIVEEYGMETTKRKIRRKVRVGT